MSAKLNLSHVSDDSISGVCVTPESFLWSNLVIQQKPRYHKILPQLCGSPLDYLPSDPHELPVPEGNKEALDTLRLRHLEIVRRSRAAEEKWLPNKADVLQLRKIMDTCVDLFGGMNNIDVEKPDAISNALCRLFKFREKFAKKEALLRSKLMFKWCSTDKR
ncbi:hypothetical protein GCK72_022840 [Caenorhabditis remanei]|uniref:Mediator complex subunit Med12 LCEWAV-domain domain-containing protein n=1 Tax=Caenorhabditis remanei TaxID=31234 RepID=A0A6A5FV42_CAERE|nr:hypothetical protein GCK72_022840 [Caenorhabditis remanei]KAF1746386.1 hypothetical protein GCK72_022840 [Caenorhabditis remanei]